MGLVEIVVSFRLNWVGVWFWFGSVVAQDRGGLVLIFKVGFVTVGLLKG